MIWKYFNKFILIFLGYAYLLQSCGESEYSQIKTEKRKDYSHGTSTLSATSRPVHWSYKGETGPEHWAELTPVYALCRTGKNQSPVNVSSSSAKGGVNWSFRYINSTLRIAHNEHMNDIVDNGHTIQITVDEGSTFILNGTTYHLKQFHFHTPSEHQLDGKHFPMEIHFVHQSDSGEFAVVSALVSKGPRNGNIDLIVQHLPVNKGETKHLKEIQLTLHFHLPDTSKAYHYIGSLTTPPCKEDEDWLILKNPIYASESQIQSIATKIGNNNRPLQSLYGRSFSQDLLKGETK